MLKSWQTISMNHNGTHQSVPQPQATEPARTLTASGNGSFTGNGSVTLTLEEDGVLGMIAHELKSPLTAARGFVNVVREGKAGPCNEQQKEFLEISEKAMDHLNGLVDNILYLVNGQAGVIEHNFQPLSLEELIHETLELYHLQAQERQIQLSAEIAEGLAKAKADSERIRRVLINLVSNAFKFTPEKGRIVIRAFPWQHQLRIEIEDSGIGIPKALIPRLFIKYSRLNGCRKENGVSRKEPGCGLGLALCKGIVEDHGGKIWVESKPGQGSVFIFTLPLATEVMYSNAQYRTK